MEAILILLSCYIFLYAFHVVRLAIAFGKVARFDVKPIQSDIAFSVIIPFRNEEKNLPALLESVLQLDYPAEFFELIFIDDFSTDRSAAIINRWRLDNPALHTTMIDSVRISNSPKKDAIQRAIPIAMHKWIVTTDADCTVQKSWLKAIGQFVSAGGFRMVCGPVRYNTRSGLSHFFQTSDLMALQGATIGGFGLKQPFMCNGANFAFEKSFFNEIGGFGGVDHVASGDDVFLLQKAARMQPDQVGYLMSGDAIVSTSPANGWIGLFNQRVRWASKSKHYISRYGETLSLVAFFGNAAMLVLMLLALTGQLSWQVFAVLFLIKFLPDFVLALRPSRFINRRWIFPIISGILYPLFATVVGLYSIYGRYTWKGRKLR